MNKTVFVLGMLIVFAFAPVDVETAMGEVDISGQCVDIVSQFGVNNKTPNDACIAAGYYGCVSVGTGCQICNNTVCGAGCCGLHLFSFSCDTPFTIAACTGVRQSVRFNTLICRDTRNWGESPPKPKNVPEDLELSLMNLINWILGFVSMVAVLFVIWGGAQYLTSAGDENKMESGKKTVTYAFIGLVIAALAYALINTIVSKILK